MDYKTKDLKESIELENYIEKKYPNLKTALQEKYSTNICIDYKTIQKNRKKIYLILFSYFCRLTQPYIVEKIDRLNRKEVTLVTQILKNEGHWHYFFDNSFYKIVFSKGENKVSKITLGYDGYEIESSGHIDFTDSSKFYLKNSDNFKKLSKVILEKKEILNSVACMENESNNMDIEVIKLLSTELDCGLDFFVKNNRKPYIKVEMLELSSKIKTFIRKH